MFKKFDIKVQKQECMEHIKGHDSVHAIYVSKRILLEVKTNTIPWKVPWVTKADLFGLIINKLWLPFNTTWRANSVTPIYCENKTLRKVYKSLKDVIINNNDCNIIL